MSAYINITIILDSIMGSFMIVSQFANSGNLRDYLQQKIVYEDVFVINWTEVIQIARQIISGLQYLYSKRIIHRNLYSKNVLVQDGIFLISDFGTEWKFDRNVFSICQGVEMPEYTDSWCYIYEELFYPNIKSDIYSLGLILWELTSRTLPFSNISNKLAIGWLIAYKGLRNESILGTPSDYNKLCNEYCVINPKNYPELDEILRRVQ
ncbi:3671_t:CDS:2 [Dentiscutata heterogama]|uniref:3671_t:CDS:1 n=1 Tax=Dentiscutata heterogama TaxID=1316150 RepID=A0ACA9MBW4_9GLOM|nr:3671_t:CDS:2 [Dentiscutata heterogama]